MEQNLVGAGNETPHAFPQAENEPLFPETRQEKHLLNVVRP